MSPVKEVVVVEEWRLSVLMMTETQGDHLILVRTRGGWRITLTG